MKPVNSFLVCIVVASVGLALAGCEAGSSGDDERGGIELGGMEMSEQQLREVTKESMGTEDLRDVPEATLDDARPDLGSTEQHGQRVFELEATPVRWEYRSRQTVAAWGYEGQVPGPTLRAREGERVVVRFRNGLPQPTTVHWHGVDVPWTEDGVPGVTQEAIDPGETYEYEFTASPAGTRWYHTHGGEMGQEASQLDMGLSGAIVIEPAEEPEPVDSDHVLVLDDWQVGERGYNPAMMTGAGHGAGHEVGYNIFTMNGRAAPDVPDIVVEEGDTVRMRIVNASTMSVHPMHLHGHQFRIVALDGNPVAAAAQTLRNVVTLQPGETADIVVEARNPGVWMFHCHELHHADGGMMQLFRYEGFEPVDDVGAGHDGDGDGTDEAHQGGDAEGTGDADDADSPEADGETAG